MKWIGGAFIVFLLAAFLGANLEQEEPNQANGDNFSAKAKTGSQSANIPHSSRYR